MRNRSSTFGATLALLICSAGALAQSAPPRVQIRPSNDNSTFAANTAYVDAAVQTLIAALKPVATSGLYTDLTGRPTLGELASKDSAAIGDVTGLSTALATKATAGANADITSIAGLTTPLSTGQGGTGANSSASARSNLGLGTMATQGAGAVSVTGGAIDGTPVGVTTPAAGSFTTLGAGILSLSTPLVSSSGGVDASATTYTPIVTAGSGALTSASAMGRYRKIGPKLVFLQVDVTITTNGTAGGSIAVTLPFTSGPGALYMLTGREVASTGALLQAPIYNAASTLSIINFDNTYPGANGRRLIISGVYETN